MQEDSQKIKSLEKDLKEAKAKPSGGGGAEDVSDRPYCKLLSIFFFSRQNFKVFLTVYKIVAYSSVF